MTNMEKSGHLRNPNKMLFHSEPQIILILYLYKNRKTIFKEPNDPPH